MKKICALMAGAWLSFSLFAQPATQTIRGTVADVESKSPLIGVNILFVTGDEETRGTVTDADGEYALEKVPVGRQTLEFSYLGYEKVILNNIIVSSGKEVVLDIEMQESPIPLEEIILIATQSNETRSDLALISARQFSVEETDRYAGSRGDVGRMASNFAGVQGADDSRNDIVIRGNTPQGLIWRLEGVNIPNPNHFAISGTAGGPVTILNNKYLQNSDFFTGAFPAEFGNGVAGAFDLRMRNGNDQRHEFSVQFGFLGTELAAEGPISKENKSSYFLSYRYSTLRLFEFMGIKVGTKAAPRYQDAAFRFNFPTKSGGNLAFWGIGGASKILVYNSQIVQRPEDLENPDLYAEADRDQVFRSRMGVAGLTFSHPLNPSTYFKATVAASNQLMGADTWKIIRHEIPDPENPEKTIFAWHINEEEDILHKKGDTIFADSVPYFLYYNMLESKFSAYLSLNKKFSRKTSLKAGLNTDYYLFNYLDTFRLVLVPADYPNNPPDVGDYRVRWDTRNEGAVLVQPYIQMLQRFGTRLSATVGLTAMYFGLNDKSLSPLEPRLGLQYALGKKLNHKLSLGYGLHSQIVPPYLYFYGVNTVDRDPQELNKDMGLFKSHHGVLGYDWFIPEKGLRLKLETYYQYLFNIPVDKEPSSFSLVNTGSGFDRLFPNELVNKGTARNYGFEATVERFFSKGYYFLFTGSVFDSKYKGSDDVLRNTTFNGRVALNGLVAKEFTFKKGSALNIGGKVTYAGGRWRGEVDEEQSIIYQKVMYIDSTMNKIQVSPYFRADLKVSFRWNRPRVFHEFSIDLVNITDRDNVLFFTYVPNHSEGAFQTTNQLGFLPIFYYKLDFGLGK